MLLVEERLCACGCGSEVTSKRKATIYIHGHNTKGKHISEAHREALLRANLGSKKSEGFRRHMRELRLGVPIHSEESKQRIGEASRRNWENGNFRSPEMSARRSQGTKRSYAEGSRKEPTVIGFMGYSIPTVYNGIHMRSKLEARTAALLDRHGIKWQYEPQRFQLAETTYLPDFFLPEFDAYLEVKWDENGEGIEKAYEFRSLGYRLTTVFHRDVTELERCD